MHHLTQLRGGIRLKSFKKFTTQREIRKAKLPKKLYLPLHQHIGDPAEPVVNIGDKVLKGQLIARAANEISAPVHASSSGTVIAIEDHPVPHPSGIS